MKAVPAPLAADMPPSPVALTLTTWWELSTTKSFGAVIVDPDVVHVDVSSSAMKASLKDVFTKPGYSSERNLKSKVRQLAPGWAARSIFSTVTSKSVLPRTLPPPRLVLAKVEGSGTEFTSPVVRMPKLEPWVGNSPIGVVDVPSGVPGGTARNDAPAMVVDRAAIAWASASAPPGPVWGVTPASAGAAPTSTISPATRLTNRATSPAARTADQRRRCCLPIMRDSCSLEGPMGSEPRSRRRRPPAFSALLCRRPRGAELKWMPRTTRAGNAGMCRCGSR